MLKVWAEQYRKDVELLESEVEENKPLARRLRGDVESEHETSVDTNYVTDSERQEICVKSNFVTADILLQ